jgi:hypothetical protein
MTIPILHLNGSSHKNLTEQYSNAYNAVQTALHELRHAAPHGRDYYVQSDPAAYTKAAGEHADRMTRLQTVSDELLALYQAVDAQEH